MINVPVRELSPTSVICGTESIGCQCCGILRFSMLRHSPSFLTKKTLNVIEESHRARLKGKTGQYRELKREAVRAVRMDDEAQVRGVCETLESHLWSTDSRPAYRGIRTLQCSKPPPCCSTLRAADRTTLTEESDIRARWTGYFEEMIRLDPPRP